MSPGILFIGLTAATGVDGVDQVGRWSVAYQILGIGWLIGLVLLVVVGVIKELQRRHVAIRLSRQAGIL